MALQGNLRDFSATEILQLCGTQKKTGCLTMEWGTERALIYLTEGRLVSTRQPGMTKDDPLLAFLRKVHRLSDEQYRGILTIQKESNRDLEDLLLNGRYFETDELSAYVERQVLDDLMRIVRWENGTYRFDPNTRWPLTPLIKLTVEGSLIEAARRVDEQKRFVTLFKDPYQLLGVRDLPDPNEPLSEEERELFGIVDGQHTVLEVVEAAPLCEYEAYEALHRMLDSNWIEFVGRRDPGQVVAVAVAGSPVTRAVRAVPVRSLFRELVVAAIVLAMLFGLRVASGKMDPTRTPPPADDVFAAAQLRDVRFALELYHRETGAYPHHLEDLVDGRWLAPEQATVPGFLLTYEPRDNGQDYELDLEPVH
jgi:hypothetical protein